MSPLCPGLYSWVFNRTPQMILRTWMVHFWGILSAKCYEVFHISYSKKRPFSFCKVLWRGSKSIEFLDGQILYQAKFPLRLDIVILRTFDTLRREVWKSSTYSLSHFSLKNQNQCGDILWSYISALASKRNLPTLAY